MQILLLSQFKYLLISYVVVVSKLVLISTNYIADLKLISAAIKANLFFIYLSIHNNFKQKIALPEK
mgnify:CR=1 FL=1